MAPARLILIVFVVLQEADGLITYSAVTIFGPHAEGNPLLETWMHVAGPGPALLGAKLLACACGVLLYTLGIRRTLAALTAFYVVAGIGPWLHVLSR
jgi:hypothetical protein